MQKCSLLSTPSPVLLFVDFLMMAILTGVKYLCLLFREICSPWSNKAFQNTCIPWAEQLFGFLLQETHHQGVILTREAIIVNRELQFNFQIKRETSVLLPFLPLLPNTDQDRTRKVWGGRTNKKKTTSSTVPFPNSSSLGWSLAGA